MALSDKELVRMCQADRAAFEELMGRYKRVVFGYAKATTGSHQDAEEVTQEVFVKIYRAAHRFDAKYSFTTWLYKITSNTCKNKLRSRSRKALSLDGGGDEDDGEKEIVVASRDPGPLETYSRQTEIEQVREAIDRLPPRYREVLYLRYVENLSYREIGTALGLSIGNVEARIFRGKDRVRRLLTGGIGKDAEDVPQDEATG